MPEELRFTSSFAASASCTTSSMSVWQAFISAIPRPRETSTCCASFASLSSFSFQFTNIPLGRWRGCELLHPGPAGLVGGVSALEERGWRYAAEQHVPPRREFWRNGHDWLGSWLRLCHQRLHSLPTILQRLWTRERPIVPSPHLVLPALPSHNPPNLHKAHLKGHRQLPLRLPCLIPLPDLRNLTRPELRRPGIPLPKRYSRHTYLLFPSNFTV